MKLRIAVTGMISMVVVMGMGRFALTPQLPHLISEGQITLFQASLLAGANFLGYLIGALETVRAKHNHILRLKCGLWGSGIILVMSALISNNAEGLYLNFILRFLAGIASAWTLVLISTWIQHQLGKEHTFRTIAFSGPGVGVFLTGIIAIGLDFCHANASMGWLVYGIAALIFSFFIRNNLPHSLPEAPLNMRLHLTNHSYRLVFSYALCGLGYVLPATFLSKLAVDQFPGSLLADSFWPLFGLAIVAGMVLLAAQRNIKNPQRWLAGIFWMQAVGILACTLLPGVFGLLIGAIFVGASLMTILQLTMYIGAALAHHHVRAMAGVLTAGFAVGQLIGPILSALSTHFWSTIEPALLMSAIGSSIAGLMVYSIRIP